MPYTKSSLKSYFIIVIATLLLYLWQLHLYPMINTDGVTYIEAAVAYLKGGLSAAVAVNYQAKWPFYSILIATTHSVTGLSVFAAERCLDIILISISACLFLYFARLLSQHKQASAWAIIMWLTWHAYVKWWPTIIRDHGFLTSLLLSFYCYYRYSLTQRFLWACAWSGCLVVAEFFRIESVVYLLVLPFSVFFLSKETLGQRITLWLKLNVLAIIAGIGVAILFADKILTHDSLRFDYIWQEFSLLFSTIGDRFMMGYKIMHQSIFYRENDFSGYALLASYIVAFAGYVVMQVSLAALPPILLMKRGLKKLNPLLLQQAFIAYFVVAFLIPLLFFAEHVFLNGRYLLPLGCFVLLLVASIVPHIIDSLVGKGKVFFITILAALLLSNFAANTLHFGHVSQDEYIVGGWLKTQFPDKTIFTNDKRILFYDSSAPDYKHGGVYEMRWGGVGDVWLRRHPVWCQYDFLVISAPPGKTLAANQMFEQFYAKGAIGPVIKRYKQVVKGEDILVAPVFAEKCQAMVAQNTEKLVDSAKRLT